MTPSIAFVCCIEAGPLEAMAVRLLRSLRESGGRFQHCPFLATIARSGPPLSCATCREISELHGLVADVRGENHFPWTPYFGKALAMAAAERLMIADTICLLDADILFMGEPNLLELNGNESFAACPAFDAAASSTGTGSDNDSVWTAACERLDLPLEKLAWTVTSTTNEKIHLHFNAGVLVARQISGFATAWVRNYTLLLNSGLSHPGWGIHSLDEVSAAITVEQLGLAWRPLPLSYNFSIPSWSSAAYRSGRYAGATLLHYHSGMSPANWQGFINCMEATHPETAAWLAPLGPAVERLSRWSEMRRACLRAVRGLRRRWHTRRWLRIGPAQSPSCVERRAFASARDTQ